MIPRGGEPVIGAWALVVSADEVLRRRAVEGITSTGLACDPASSGAEALAAIESVRRPYALIVVDTDLPDVALGEFAAIAAIMAPHANWILCGAGVSPRLARRPVLVRKPALQSEFARAVEDLRGRPAAADMTA